jgi:hypothetical protein
MTGDRRADIEITIGRSGATELEMEACPACGFPRMSHPIMRIYPDRVTDRECVECAEFRGSET